MYCAHQLVKVVSYKTTMQFKLQGDGAQLCIQVSNAQQEVQYTKCTTLQENTYYVPTYPCS